MGGRRIVVFGDVIDDVIVTPVGEVRPDTDTTARIERRAGGSAANAAAWFAHEGERVEFFGRVSAADVERHTAELRACGVAAHLGAETELPTGTIVVILQADRTRTMLTERGANARTAPGDIDRSLFQPGSHLHVTGYSVFTAAGEEVATLIQDAVAAGLSVSVNPGSAGFIADHGAEALLAATAGATVLIPNLDEGRALTGLTEPARILDALLEHAPVVALTLGRAGVLAASREHGPVEVPAIAVDPVDTTGAGDAFSAGFVASLLRSGAVGAHVDAVRLTEAGRAGVACAAEAIQQVGARPRPGAVAAIPDRSAVRRAG
jgi:sugar/nucleoside kinase (ribokinase family)